MPKQEQYTLEEAKKRAAELGSPWTPTLEAQLRKAGKIADAAPMRPERSFGDQMKMAVQSLAQYVPGGYGYDPQERIETGTSSGDLYIDSALKASTLGLLNLDRLGGGEAGPVTNNAQLAMSALGTGTGMIGPLRAITPAASMAATKLVPSVAAPFTNLAAREAVARTLFGSGLALGGYEALMPGSPAERLERAGQGFQSGVALAGVPAAVGASNPVARKAVEFGTMYGLGAAQGMPADENLIQSVAMMLPAEALHAGQAASGTPKAAKPAKRTPEQVAAEIEALEARLTNERAPVQAEIAARVAPFREAQANAQGIQQPVPPSEYGKPLGPETLPPRGNAPEVDAAARERAQAVQAETLARERADYESKKAFEADFRQRMEAERRRRLAEEAAVPPLKRPLQPEIKWSPNPDQYSRTEARIAAMRARQAAPAGPKPKVIALQPDGTVVPMPERPPMEVGTGTPPEKPVFTGPVVEGEAIPGNMAESAQRYAYESTMRDAAERRAAAASQQPASEAPPVKETRGQRRARLQAEASQVNAEAARRMGTDIGQEPVAVAPEATQNNVELTSRNRLVKPITGKTGSSIVGYQWMSMTEEGMFRDRKVSDWTRSQKSEPTGRDIVHVFFVRSPDGAIKVMGVGAAQKALGISTDRLYSIAKAEQQMARQRIENQNKDEIRISEKVASASPGEAARKWRTTNGADADIRKTTLLEKGGKFFRTLDANLIETLKDRGWSESTSDPVRKPSTDLTLGMGGGQQVFEAVGRALKDVAAEVKDTPRRMRNIKAAADTDFEAARAELVKNVDENPVSVPFSRANRGEQTYEQAVNDVVSMPRRVRKLTDLRAYPDKATEGVKDIIDTDNLAALRADISKPLAARLDQAPGSDLPEKQRGLTDPVRKTQETMDGELASAVEMSEIHGGREIEMATYKKAAEFGSQYKDLKKRTGVTGNDQLEIAGRLLENYTSRNRGHVGNDLEFVQDPANRQLLAESGNPQGMFEYVKGVRELMDSAGNLYNKASKGMGGEGMGDIAAYFPKVGVKPKFFEVGERMARAKARKGADPRTRNTADQVFNPRSQRRSTTDPNKVEMDGREIAREWNAETVLEGYLDTMLRGVSGDIALSQSMKAAKYDDILADRAERAGNQQEADNRRRRADVIRTLAQQKWNHQLFGVGARAEDVFKAFGAPGSMALEAVAANKRMFDNTKYRLNPRFNLVTQWTSILNPSMADPVAAMLALRDMGVPGLPTEAKKFAESTYEVRRKAMPHSQMRAQVEGTGSLGESLSAPTGTARKFANVTEKVFFDGLTQGIENWANKYSALIGYHSTRNLQGLTPRQRALAAGQTVFKTQSAFTFGERAGVLNSRAVQGLAPAQGYAVDLANQIREALGATGVDTKLYGETGSQQARRAGAIVAAAVMQNVWQNVIFNAMRGKDPEESLNFDSIWDATVALPPFISLLLPTGKGGRDMPNPVLPVAQVNTIANKGGKVASKLVKGEDATGAAVDLLRYGAANWGGPGGSFASDLTGGRYDFLMGDDEGADAPNTVQARPVAPRKSSSRKAVARR